MIAGMRFSWLGYLLDAAAAALLLAMAVRHSVGYVPKFFTIAFPIAFALLAIGVAAAIARRTAKAIFDVVILSITASVTVCFGLTITGYFDPGPAALYEHRRRDEARVLLHPLPGNVQLFRDGFDKRQLASFDDLVERGSRYAARWQERLVQEGFSPGEAKAVGLMLFASTLWASGNAQHADKPGCIPTNEDNGWHLQRPTLEVVKRTAIGCCTDYAQVLSLLLAGNGFENRYAIIPGHVVNEAKIDGRWRVLDANTNVFANVGWNEAARRQQGVAVHYFPHPGTMNGKLYRANLENFQDYLVNLLLRGTPTAKLRDGRMPGPAEGPLELLY